MINNDFQEKEYRIAFVDAMIRTGVAFQIKALRQREDMSQQDLGEIVNTPQNVISRYENSDYDGFTLKTLKRLASAFDVALIVKFASFGELRDLTKDRSPEVLAVPSFSKEQELKDSLAIPNSLITDAQIEIGKTIGSDLTNVTSFLGYKNQHNQTNLSNHDHLHHDFTAQDEYSHASR